LKAPSRGASVRGLGATLDDVSKLLRRILGRQVINKTGIAGRFDVHVDSSPEGTELEAVLASAPDPAGPPTISTAIHEPLGLRLDSGKGLIDALVIDHIEMPAEN